MIPPPDARPFLAAAGWAGAEVVPLAGDASFRRYFRVVEPGRTAVLMDAPPAHEDVRPFLAVARHLESLGLSAPRTLAEDIAGGLLLLEDFGDRLVGPLLREDARDERRIYAAAVDLLAELARHPAPAEWMPAYDGAVLRREVDLFVDWYAPALGIAADRAAWTRAWEPVLAAVAEPARPVMVLRDFHVDNILLLDRPGVRELGLLDFQDALVGHAAYDLVSLLQDARRDVSPALETEMRARCPQAALPGFDAAYAILGAQRGVKILGIFTRLWKRDGKAHYLRHLPRVWGYVARDLAHPALAPVADWFSRHVPEAARAAAWQEPIA
jgi:hypothetical protein